jgi:hypothetical protein
MTSKSPMMKCGCAANATNSKGKPCCVICVGINSGAEVVDTSPPDLTGRVAKCPYISCKSQRPSSEREKLAFFVHKPGKPFDEYYCGCHGWD